MTTELSARGGGGGRSFGGGGGGGRSFGGGGGGGRSFGGGGGGGRSVGRMGGGGGRSVGRSSGGGKSVGRSSGGGKSVGRSSGGGGKSASGGKGSKSATGGAGGGKGTKSATGGAGGGKGTKSATGGAGGGKGTKSATGGAGGGKGLGAGPGKGLGGGTGKGLAGGTGKGLGSGPGKGKSAGVGGTGKGLSGGPGRIAGAGGNRIGVRNGPYRLWWGGRWVTFVGVGTLAAILIGSDYYYPYGYVSIAQPYCSGLSEDGCRLNWQTVALEEGGEQVQCVQYCPRRVGAAAVTPAAAVALASVPPQTRGNCEVVIYSDTGLKGLAAPTSEDQPTLVEAGWKNEIASLEVKAGTWDFFTDENYAGATMRLAPGTYGDIGADWVKKISSFSCTNPGS